MAEDCDKQVEVKQDSEFSFLYGVLFLAFENQTGCQLFDVEKVDVSYDGFG